MLNLIKSIDALYKKDIVLFHIDTIKTEISVSCLGFIIDGEVVIISIDRIDDITDGAYHCLWIDNIRFLDCLVVSGEDDDGNAKFYITTKLHN